MQNIRGGVAAACVITVITVIYCLYRATNRRIPHQADQLEVSSSNERELLHDHQRLPLEVDNLSKDVLGQTDSADKGSSPDKGSNVFPTSTISGKVRIAGAIPAAKRIPVEIDPQCTMIRDGEILLQQYRTDEQGGLSDVLVFLDLADKLKAHDLQMPAQILDRTRCEFQPRVLGMHSSRKLIIRNSDPVIHDIHFSPEIPKYDIHDRAQLPNGIDREYSLDGILGILQVRCYVHPWMYAYVGVFDHPFFATPGEHGEFSLQGVPGGEYTLKAFHPNAGRLSVSVKVVPPVTTEVNLVFQVTKQP